PNQKWLARQFVDHAVEICFRFDRAPVDRGSAAGLSDREGGRGIATDLRQKADHVARRHAEELPDRPQLLAFRQQVRGPGQKDRSTVRLRREQHGRRNREGAARIEPGSVVSEGRAPAVDFDETDRSLLEVDRKITHEFRSRAPAPRREGRAGREKRMATRSPLPSPGRSRACRALRQPRDVGRGGRWSCPTPDRSKTCGRRRSPAPTDLGSYRPLYAANGSGDRTKGQLRRRVGSGGWSRHPCACPRAGTFGAW